MRLAALECGCGARPIDDALKSADVIFFDARTVLALASIPISGLTEERFEMNAGRSLHWMWTDAVVLLERMQRAQQQSFAPLRAAGGAPNWEPPADMIETDREVLVLVSLPGVDPEQTDVRIEEGMLVVRGQRILPPELRTARIHRLELPQGQFERRLALPQGRYEDVRRSSANGCLIVTLHKASSGGVR